MGNNPSSTSRPATQPSSSSQSQHSNDSPRPVKRENKLPLHGHRTAAPPEPSLAQAQGSTSTTNNNTRPKSLQPRPVSSLNNSSASSPAASSVASSKPVDVTKPRSDVKNEPTKPLTVPNSHHSPPPTSPLSPFSETLEASAMMQHNSIQDMGYLARPPRLPLPIETEVHTPGSPIIAPADIGEPVDDVDELDADGLPTRTSGLSTTTVDEEDAEEFRVDKAKPTVPVRLEWTRGGGKVYVTGTIFQWNRKTRLLPVEGRPGVFGATVHVLPGTHQVRFLVDGQMQTSPDMPTTVDYGNNLVNYVEVHPTKAQAGQSDASGAATTVGKDAQPPASAKQSPSMESQDKRQRDRVVTPVEDFSEELPEYLRDFDQPDNDPLYLIASKTLKKLPTPPSLPGFLGKPILNAATLIKDDNSVLNMPNHTVLNHLATSSIKNAVLAVSATTRYQHKYVTTIIYKPTGKEDKKDGKDCKDGKSQECN